MDRIKKKIHHRSHWKCVINIVHIQTTCICTICRTRKTNRFYGEYEKKNIKKKKTLNREKYPLYL